MNRSTLAPRAALATGMAAVAVAAGITVAAAATGNTSATTHTMRFVGTQINDVISNDVDVATDKNTWKGKTTGYDVTSCAIDIHTHVAACKVAVARAGGILYGRAKVNVDTGRGSGTVTGGSGRFHGATGTMTISPGSNENSNKITITYQA
jgi:hypothetical protein